MVLRTTLLITCILFTSFASASNYPAHWWQEVSESERQGRWEILPHEVKRGELVLSKRNELGVFSNLALSPFYFEGAHYASIESLWQMMKYPDITDSNDPRNNFKEYPYKRNDIYNLHGFEAKRAGDVANKINKKYGIKQVSYKKYFFNYKDMKTGSKFHYKIIKKAIEEKVIQNPHIKKLLMKTKGLKLKPDHKQGSNPPASYLYHKILMEIRDR